MTNEAVKTYEALAAVLEYPGDEWPGQLEFCGRLLGDEWPELMPEFQEFHRGAADMPVAVLQEQYTRTFDLNPVCNLEIGYHLFGENYKRGIFLANLREMELSFQLDEKGQLPDYLPLLLRLLARLDQGELRMDLITECLIPALNKMLDAMSKAPSSYSHLLQVVSSMLQIEARANRPGYDVNASPFNEKKIFLPVLQ